MTTYSPAEILVFQDRLKAIPYFALRGTALLKGKVFAILKN